MSDTLLDPAVDEQLKTDGGDHDRFSHYAPKDYAESGGYRLVILRSIKFAQSVKEF